ncbi:hypothetical protein [Ruegeria sp. HKCCD8929]|uniref:hypothetical protein n=1 Tax=Ruegeria sp. HKCCD8929 TaxID=2683006 RepID=UPI0014895F3F|nr:hypothetical protein [Ruegeria sp. HKCCD8929]
MTTRKLRIFPYHGVEVLQFVEDGFFLAFKSESRGTRSDSAGNVLLRQNSTINTETQLVGKQILKCQRKLCAKYFDAQFSMQNGVATPDEKAEFYKLLREFHGALVESLDPEEYLVVEVRTPEPNPFVMKSLHT